MIRRSSEMYLVGYFLSRCGRSQLGKPSLPPKELGVDQWNKAYAAFYAKLGQGRAPASFANSLKAVRDAFDMWNESSGRQGWKDSSGSQRTQPTGMLADVLESREACEASEVWNAVRRYVSP